MNRTDTLLRLKRFRVDEMKRRIAASDVSTASSLRRPVVAMPRPSPASSFSLKSGIGERLIRS